MIEWKTWKQDVSLTLGNYLIISVACTRYPWYWCEVTYVSLVLRSVRKFLMNMDIYVGSWLLVMVLGWKVKETWTWRLAIPHKGSCPLNMLIILDSRTAASSGLVVLNRVVGGLVARSKSLTTWWLILCLTRQTTELHERCARHFSEHIHAQKCPQVLTWGLIMNEYITMTSCYLASQLFNSFFHLYVFYYILFVFLRIQTYTR